LIFSPGGGTALAQLWIIQLFHLSLFAAPLRQPFAISHFIASLPMISSKSSVAASLSTLE
jgi:hypothetical protein